MELVCTKTIRMHSNVSLRSVFRVVMSVMISHKTMFGSPLPPVVFIRVHVLITFIVFACVYLCPTHIVLYFCFVFLRLVYSMLPGSLDCLFLIVPSVFSNIYLQKN